MRRTTGGTVRLLLTAAIDANHLGWTALLEAVILGDGGPAHAETVRLLVARHADANLPDRDGVTPIGWMVGVTLRRKQP